MENLSLTQWVRSIQTRCEAVLDACMPLSDEEPVLLHQAMRYVLLDGGKRIRSLLVFAAGEVSRADSACLDVAASALEMIHAYSLVHDDLPCMDDDILRRGRAACHVKYGEAIALLVGDSLQTLAFQVLAEAKSLTAAQKVEMIAQLAKASGSRGMAGGQTLDLTAIGEMLDQPKLEAMHLKKTGALIRAAVGLGVSCGESTPADRARLDRFATRTGLLFQIVDDVLDVTVDSQTLGKTAGKDVAAGKPTFVSLMGLDGARRYAEKVKCEAQDVLQPLGARARRLYDLTDFITTRTF